MLSSLIRRTVMVLAVIVALPIATLAAPSMQGIFDATQAMTSFEDVSLSPDGTRVAWTQSARRKTSLWIENLSTHNVVRLTAGDGKAFADESEPVWSPDGSRVAFFSDARSAGHTALYVARFDGTGVRHLAAVPGASRRLTWSPDGAHLALLNIPHPHRKAGATSPGARDVGVIGSVTDEQQLATVDLTTGALHMVTPGTDYVYEYSWSPNSRNFALTYARGNGDDNWWIAKLATVPSNGGVPHDVLAPKYQINDPQWSPDGKSIAVIGGIMSDFGPVGGDIYAVDVANRTAKDVSENMHYSAAAIRWVAPKAIMFVAHDAGSLHLMRLDPSTGAIRVLTKAQESLRNVSFSRDASKVALVRSSFTLAPEIWAGTPTQLARLTHANANAPQFNGKAVSLTWTNDSYHVQGWLISPRDYRPSKKYPMVTIIHGGPSSESTPNFGNRNIAALSSRGYFVFEPNPRGSYGQGEAFSSANVKDFGYGDWRDDLAGIDAAIASAPIDTKRLGLFGWSYGGYMAMWAETKTDRFKGIVAGAGLVNWQSYYGQNKIDQWMIPFFGASVYDDPDVYAKSSPITFIKDSKTPVLIIAGERDEEVPAAQSFEFYHAMQTLGVPSQLVVYADEGHAPQKPADQVDILTRLVGWFDRYLR